MLLSRRTSPTPRIETASLEASAWLRMVRLLARCTGDTRARQGRHLGRERCLGHRSGDIGSSLGQHRPAGPRGRRGRGAAPHAGRSDQPASQLGDTWSAAHRAHRRDVLRRHQSPPPAAVGENGAPGAGSPSSPPCGFATGGPPAEGSRRAGRGSAGEAHRAGRSAVHPAAPSRALRNFSTAWTRRFSVAPAGRSSLRRMLRTCVSTVFGVT
jgi:hypothetical protein